MGPAEGVMTSKLINDFESLDLLEGSKTLLDSIPDHARIAKYCSMFEDFCPIRKYDTIIMEHVLEHIEFPITVLQKVKEWLTDEGTLIIGVPNAKSFHRLAAVKMGLLSSEYELNDRDKQLGHYRVYDFNLLTDNIKKAGLTILHRGGVFLKFLSNKQLEENLSSDIIKAYYELGGLFKENCAEIFVIAKP